MKRYLIVKHFYKETYTTDTLTKEDLLGLKNRDCEAIIDFQQNAYLDPDINSWKEIKEI